MYNFVDVLTNVNKNDLPQKRKQNQWCVFLTNDAHLLLGLKNYVLWI